MARPDILVTGDVTVDWILAVPSLAAPADTQTAYQYQWESRSATGLSAQPGGASLLASLIKATGVAVSHRSMGKSTLEDPVSSQYSRSFSLWQPHPISTGQAGVAWRMQRFLGVRPATSQLGTDGPGIDSTACIVVDDASLGFRHEPRLWPAILSAPGIDAQIVLKMAAPLTIGPLWDHLISEHADRLTVYVALWDLRKGDAAIGQPLSWEQLAQDVVQSVRGDAEFARAARVVVSIGFAGAVVIERSGTSTLVYDPLRQEGDWERAYPGMPSGLGTCLTAALALEASHAHSGTDWARAAARGLRAARVVHKDGFEFSEAEAGALRFPVDAVARLLPGGAPDEGDFSISEIDASPSWQILSTDFADDFLALARRIVIEGDVDACQGLPVEHMGSWMSIDRTEIESIRSLRNIVRQYLSQPVKTRPLSLAVFGPPGSGKSFAVKQMAKEWSAGGLRIDVLEFNVSQFDSAADLAAALQRVRDGTVQQALPLVFWDEFDSPCDGRELGWLARFLAPMQDGHFLEAGIVRPIGPALFVFAGGTHSTLATFKDRAVTVPGSKATDFLSRLRGHVDVLGPNPRDEADRGFVLRRALLLRSILLVRAQYIRTGTCLNIDPGVLRAFLEAPAYVHGARSLEAIVEMSALAGRLRYERSSLPAPHQLALHVDPDAFLELASRSRT